MKYIQIYENFNTKKIKNHKTISEIILESFFDILKQSFSVNEDSRSKFDPQTGITKISLTSGERRALARDYQILEDEQLFGAYLRALDEYTGNNFVESIEGIDDFKRTNNKEYISDLDLAIALNYERLATFLLDKNKFISLLNGDRSFANRVIDSKRLEIFELLKGFEPEDIVEMVTKVVQNKSLPRILKKEKYQDPLIQKNIFMWVQDTIDQLKINRTSGMFKTYPGNQKWQSDMAQVINNAAKRFNKEPDEILAIYQDEKSKREKSMSSMRGRPARKY
jgi:hypothetical protein